MLEQIRGSAQSFGVKIAFGLIILVFVFWGVGNFNDRDYTNVVAVVNGQPIVAMEFEKAYQQAEDYIMRSNPGVTREQLAQQHLGRQVLRDLIQQTLLLQEADRSGVHVSPVEMRRHVDAIKSFQDENGRFSPEIYKRVLAAQRITPAQYENELRDQLLQEKLYQLVTAPVWVDPDEALNRFNFLRETREIDYIFIPAKDFLEKAAVDEKAIRDWYNSHKDDFIIPATVQLDYIQVHPGDLVDKAAIDQGRIREWYEANQSRYAIPERVKAAHILVPLGENASEATKESAYATIEKIRGELAAGRKFADLADQYNKPGAAGKGGELGWISRGQTVPAFEEAIFAAEPGKPGGIVETPFGLHLVLVEEKQPAGLRPLDEVENEIRDMIAFEDGSEKLHDTLDNLIEDNILQKPLADSAAKYGLKLASTDRLSRVELQEKLGLGEADAASLMNLPAGSAPDTALTAGDSYIIARVMASEPQGVKPLEAVSGDIRAILKDEGALKLAAEQAKAILAKIRDKNPGSLGEYAKDLKKDIKVDRREPVPGFMPDPTLNADIFDARLHTWLAEPHIVGTDAGSGALLVYLDRILPPSAEEFANVGNLLQQAAEQDRKEAMYALFLQHLADGAKIEITNQNIVERTGR